MGQPSLAVVTHAGPVPGAAGLSPAHALAALSALGQPTRLEIFRMLMRAEPHGRPAGAIAAEIGCPHNTLSSHLAILARAGLVRGARNGRAIVYRADMDGMRALVAFLVKDCCAENPQLCGLQDALTAACCAPSGRRKPGRR